MTELIYFTGPHCAVCHALRPKLLKAVEESFPNVAVKIIDVEKDPLTAGQSMVFTLPVVIIKSEEKEVTRFARSFSIQQVLSTLKRLSY